jgi:hypothetical protein
VLVTTFITGFGLFASKPLEFALFACGFGIGNFLWLETLMRLVLHYHAHVPERTFIRIQRIMASIVVAAGLILGLRIIRL